MPYSPLLHSPPQWNAVRFEFRPKQIFETVSEGVAERECIDHHPTFQSINATTWHPAALEHVDEKVKCFFDQFWFKTFLFTYKITKLSQFLKIPFFQHSLEFPHWNGMF